MRHNKDQQNLNDSFNKISKSPQNETRPAEEIKTQLNMDFLSTTEEAEKQNKSKYPFDVIESEIQAQISREYPNDYKIINSIEDRFLYSYFKNLARLSIGSLDLTLNELSSMIDKYYNILSEQANEFVSLFYIVFESYSNAPTHLEQYEFEESSEITKFHLFHRKIIKDFFPKCQKNRSEEMYYLFRYIIIEKIFELMNDIEYEQKFSCFCEVLFYVLDPWENQQLSFIKLVKENLIREELVYDCLGYYHLLLKKNLSEGFVDGCLFYVLNGFSHESERVRYNSLLISLSYISNLNINFYYNFESKFLLADYL